MEVAVRDLAPLRAAILEWYARERRNLPWRGTHNPYAVLVSEVMLQQTQASRVALRGGGWAAGGCGRRLWPAGPTHRWSWGRSWAALCGQRATPALSPVAVLREVGPRRCQPSSRASSEDPGERIGEPSFGPWRLR